jgi:acyl-CoA thioester hydrolase
MTRASILNYGDRTLNPVHCAVSTLNGRYGLASRNRLRAICRRKANMKAIAGDPMSREQFWFFHPFRVRYSEIDGQGVVFNAHYLTYFDTTITEYFRALGYDQYADAKQTGEDFHVVKSVIEYKAPVRFDWELDVGARVARIGNSSLTFELAIFMKGGNEALVTGEIVWVNTNQQTHRPVPISKAIRERIAAREKHLA